LSCLGRVDPLSRPAKRGGDGRPALRPLSSTKPALPSWGREPANTREPTSRLRGRHLVLLSSSGERSRASGGSELRSFGPGHSRADYCGSARSAVVFDSGLTKRQQIRRSLMALAVPARLEDGRILVGISAFAAVTALAAASGGYFPTSWNWATLGFAWAAALALALRGPESWLRRELLLVVALLALANGALSNPQITVELSRLSAIHGRLLLTVTANPRHSRSSPARPSPVVETITCVLELAGRPMRAREIHAAAEQLFGQPLRWTSLKGALAEHASSPERRFRRVRRGVYELASSAGQTAEPL
jgi:hypothetical protein